MTCYEIAREMLGYPVNKKLPDGLVELLHEVNELCQEMGGQVVSCQVVALVIVMERHFDVERRVLRADFGVLEKKVRELEDRVNQVTHGRTSLIDTAEELRLPWD